MGQSTHTPPGLSIPSRYPDVTGRPYHRLTPAEYLGRKAAGSQGKTFTHYWRCRCECGNDAVVTLANLRSGQVRSCGCMRREACMTHGLYLHPAYRIWIKIKVRCLDVNSTHYAYYGGRGITVAAEWVHDFPAFLAHVGERPTSEHTIERIDNNLGYEPGNVRWATRKEQQRNRRNNVLLTLDGVTLCLSEWAERLGVPREILRGRVRYGWSDERVLTTPHEARRI